MTDTPNSQPSTGINRSVDVVDDENREDEITPIGTTGHLPKGHPMRAHFLLPVIAVALFVAYSVVVTATSGAASFVASPMLIAAITMMVWHDRATETA